MSIFPDSIRHLHLFVVDFEVRGPDDVRGVVGSPFDFVENVDERAKDEAVIWVEGIHPLRLELGGGKVYG